MATIKSILIRSARCLVILSVSAAAAQGENRPQPLTLRTLDVDSGDHDGFGESESMLFRQTVRLAGTPLMQLKFAEANLAEGSYLIITSMRDGGHQILNAQGLANWGNHSAMFNGDELEITLHVAPNDRGVYFVIEGAYATPDVDAESAGAEPPVQASICNDADNRSHSTDGRVARLSRTGYYPGGCTAWLVSNGAVLTAGHCGAGGDLSGRYLEFNVPNSSSNGTPVAADPDDQFPVNTNVVWYENSGEGHDFHVFNIFPNTTTGQRAHVAQGYFRMTTIAPPVDSTVRVTGYGLDNIPTGSGGAEALCCDASNDDVCEYNCNSTSLTQQTNTGRVDNVSGGLIEHEADTMPANSGSPIIRESNGYAVGIHTSGGCDSIGSDYDNAGTFFGNSSLASGLNDWPGSNTVFVDAATSFVQTGSVFNPWKTVIAAGAAAPVGSQLYILPGSYTEAAGNIGTINREVTLKAPMGVVTIGN